MAGFTSNSVDLAWQPIAIPAVCILIFFLGYSSQLLFRFAENLEPGPVTRNEAYIFNSLLACVWITYYTACTVHPGRFLFPKQKANDLHLSATKHNASNNPRPLQAPRWCRKCAAPKPARAHHCRHCRRCIPKMDHHCPWTANCVSYTTFPHFLRFLVYTNVSLVYFLVYLLLPRLSALYENRHLPSYLGPSVGSLTHLTLLLLVGGITEFALLVMLVSTARSWIVNTTMIESWEIDRHEALLSRGSNGCITCPHPNTASDASDFDDDYLPEQVEFPYDLGFFDNMAQGMGSRNPLLWFLPILGSTTTLSKHQDGDGWSWAENGFNDRCGMWPPADPEKESRERAAYGLRDDQVGLRAFEESYRGKNSEEIKAAFKARQAADFARQRSIILAELEEFDQYDMVEEDEGSANAEGEKPGVSGFYEVGGGQKAQLQDEVTSGPRVVEIGDDEENVPLAEVLRRRRVESRVVNDE